MINFINDMKKFLFLLFSVVFLLASCKSSPAKTVISSPSLNNLRMESLYAGEDRIWEHVFNVKKSFDFKKESHGAIVPSNLVSAPELAKFYNGLSQKITPSTIFIIANNPNKLPENVITTCQNCVFETTHGQLDIDHYYIDQLLEKNIASVEDDEFPDVSAVFNHAPFIKNYFPSAQVVPILISRDAKNIDVTNLVNWLNEFVGDDDLVLLSMGFSKNQPWGVADFHDRSAVTTINNFDFDNVYDLEVDSPLGLLTLMKFMDKKNYHKVRDWAGINTADYLEKPTDKTISFRIMSFEEGEINEINGVSILSFGNTPEDNSLNFGIGWNYIPNYNYKIDKTDKKMLKDLAGEEDRFLTGSDFLAFNLPANQCRQDEQNGMTIAFCSFDEDDTKESEQIAKIKELDKEVDLIYLLYNFHGSGKISDDRKHLIRDFARKGVDIFVGRGIEEQLPIAMYKKKLLSYSLGYFIKDNKLVNELQNNGSGLILGIYATSDQYDVYLFPIDIVNGYPVLKSYLERKNFIKDFVMNSDLPRKTDIDYKRGVLHLTR